ncbi:MAG: hypothetical protein Faunusvirus1_42 [Faunusvirus sp.]|jgi:hypothetical protein|uniref:Uncharacterized protein n=1 Tax=Faunusvirus sp. TaxID=2487766 RepID=A0A3G4ZVU2_9VIRU|nr:MAG: hypothetical protein Faunusvirus1_42 [Faunusvirus sp.]
MSSNIPTKQIATIIDILTRQKLSVKCGFADNILSVDFASGKQFDEFIQKAHTHNLNSKKKSNDTTLMDMLTTVCDLKIDIVSLDEIIFTLYTIKMKTDYIDMFIEQLQHTFIL